MKNLEEVLKALRNLTRYALFLAALLIFAILADLGWIRLSLPNFGAEEVVKNEIVSEEKEELANKGEVDDESGLIINDGIDIVKIQCGACHSTRLVAQNRFTRDGWKELIVWMQKTQNLWDLGEQESVILDYLEANYSPLKTGRRKNLENIDWYVL